MNSNYSKIIGILAFSVLFNVSCSKTDDNPDPDPTPTDASILVGNLIEDRELDPNVTYSIAGVFSVESGATLTIPAGTQLISEVGTDKYIVIQKGGKINIQGTSSSPVIMTSKDQNPGDWGGLVIAGKATTTEGVDAIAEVGGILYGGTDDTDNSGSINHLIINYAGAQINAESQYNGLTLYSVGSGTSIENVAILNGTDDGVEFFGGTVSVTNFYLENNEDDAVDWTEGWSGSITNTYVLHTIAGFSTVVEGDNVNNNPQFINFTAVSTVGGTALQFKKESGGTFTGLSLSGYDVSIDMKDSGPLANVLIDGVVGDPTKSYLADPTVDMALFDWVDAEPVVFSEDLTGTITSDLTLDASLVYRLRGSFSVEAPATLTIPAGTLIVADASPGEETSTYIVIKKGAKIAIQGTAAEPVVMTSASESPGDWGGLVILGEAVTTEGIDAIAEVGGFIYGGTNNADNSGSIDYLVINYAGAQINAESQYNGLTLYAVGSETAISNVAILNGTDDGVEFFGGAVSVTNFYLENNEDDAVDWTEGWSGSVTNGYIRHTIAGFSTAFEGDGINNNPTFENFTINSTVGGTGLQFKKESGGTIINMSLTGYTTNVDMKDAGPLANVIVDGTPLVTATDDVFNGTGVDTTLFSWITGE